MKTMILFLILIAAIGMKVLAQKLYLKNGRYEREVPTESQKGYAEMQGFFLGDFYPRLSLTGFSAYKSRFGVSGFADIGKTRDARFSEKGYPLSEEMYLMVSAAATYYLQRSYYEDRFFLLGMGYTSHKSFLGPIGGFMLHNKNWSLEAIGQYSIAGRFRKFYQEEGVDYFDPDSWYKFSLLRKFQGPLSIGLYSERFYLSGLMAEFNLPIPENRLGLKLRTYFGQDFVSNNLAGGLGLSITTLNQ